MLRRFSVLAFCLIPGLVGCPAQPAPEPKAVETKEDAPAAVTPPKPDDAAVVEKAKGFGAKVTLNKDKQAIRVDASGKSFTDAKEALEFLTVVASLPNVFELKVFGPGIDDAAVKPLAGHAGLRLFEAVNTSLGDPGLTVIAGLPKLETLYARRANVGLGLLSDETQSKQVDAALDKMAAQLVEGTPVADLKPAQLIEEPTLKAKLEGSSLKAMAASSTIRNIDLRYTNVTDIEVAYLGRMSQLRTIRLEESRVTDKCIPFIAQMSGLTLLNIKGATFSSAGLKGLKSLTNLVVLEVDDTRLTDEGLLELAGLTKLKELHLRRTQVANAGIEVVKNMPELRVLKLRDTLITDVGLPAVAGLKNLVELDLSEGIFSDAGLPHLAGLTNLEDLSLWATDTSDEGLDHLLGLKKLKRLSLEKTRITDAGVPKLAALESLEELNLGETEITGAALESLTEFKNLKKLTVTNCFQVGSDSVDALKEKLPKLVVVGP